MVLYRSGFIFLLDHEYTYKPVKNCALGDQYSTTKSVLSNLLLLPAMFASDHVPAPAAALYGTHPFYSVVEDEAGNTHSVLFLNSNAQEVQLTPAPGIVYRTIGRFI